MTPKEARTLNQICDLPRDNIGFGDFTMMFNGEREMYFSEQAIGESPKQQFRIPRHVFEKFIRWYETGRMRGKE